MKDNAKGFIACVALALCLLASALSWPMMKLGALFAEYDFTDSAYADWITSAFIITEVAMIPVVGKLIDHIGLRKCVLFGTVSFGAFSLLCTFAEQPVYLAFFRALQGLGAAFLFASAFSAPGLLFPHGERGTQHGLMTGAFAIGSFFGTSLGLYLSINLDWRYIYYIPTLMAVVGGCIAWYLIPAHNQTRPGFDCIGCATLFAALLAGMMYTQTVNKMFEMFSWNSAAFLILIILLVLAFYLHERDASCPVFPKSLRGVNLKIALGILLVASFVLGLLQFYVKIYILNYCDLTDTSSYPSYIYEACGMFTFLLIGGALTSLPGGHISPHTGARPWCLFGFVMTALGLVLTAYIVDEGVWCMALCLFVLGVGLGSMVTLLLISLQGLTPRDEMATTTSLTMGMRVMAIASGLSIYSDYSNRRLSEYLRDVDPDIGDPETFWELIEAILTAIGEVLEGAVAVTVDAFVSCALFAVAFCFVGFIITYSAGTADKGLCPPHEKKRKGKLRK